MAHYGPLFGPVGFSLAPFEAVFENPNIWTGYRTTLWVVAVGLPLNIFMTMLGAYFLSRKDVMLGRLITMLILFTMYFSGGMIPRYILIDSIGLTDTRWALVLPVLVSTYNMIIMRTAFAAVPASLEESAKLDGANHYIILFRIMMPLCMPTIAVLILYYGVQHWNAWFDAMLFIRQKTMYPLQLILREILVQNDTSSMTAGSDIADIDMISQTIQYAVIVIATLPILCLYPFLQRYFIKGVMIGAVKG
jgi:putative aldouronate transport system permease protein